MLLKHIFDVVVACWTFFYDSILIHLTFRSADRTQMSCCGKTTCAHAHVAPSSASLVLREAPSRMISEAYCSTTARANPVHVGLWIVQKPSAQTVQQQSSRHSWIPSFVCSLGAIASLAGRSSIAWCRVPSQSYSGSGACIFSTSGSYRMSGRVTRCI